jgi:hypothetical protein
MEYLTDLVFCLDRKDTAISDMTRPDGKMLGGLFVRVGRVPCSLLKSDEDT